ncbi:MAG: patatin-like phospholipase family protein [Candidatus Paracaedibacter sp.]
MLKLLGTAHVLLLLSIGFTVQAEQITPQTPKPNPSPSPSNQGRRPLPTPPQNVLKQMQNSQPKTALANKPSTTSSAIKNTSTSITSKQDATALGACKSEGNKSPILVLSIDGASVRGIAQFELLLGIEEQVNAVLAAEARAANQPFTRINITEIFDFFAGTSAGSVNVGALLIPSDYALANTPGHVNTPKISSDELKKMLPDTLKAAFSSSTFRNLRTLQVPGVGGLLGSKFTAGPFEQLLQGLAGAARMSDLVKPAVITSYDLRAREIMNFSTYDACSIAQDDVIRYQPQSNKDFHRKDKNVFIWEAVRASSAAPVYYKPLELEIGGKLRALIDAGLFVMSPTVLAWIEAQKVYPGRPLIIISISSGNIDEARQVQTKGSTAGSIPKVLQPTIETALEGQQALADLMMRDLPGIKYHRLSFEVKNKVFDDVSAENIKNLQEAAKTATTTINFKSAVNDIVAAIRDRKAKLKQNPSDFTPFVCKAKEKFRKNNDLRLSPDGLSSDDKKQKIKAALGKMEDAKNQMGKTNEQGKRIVQLGANDTKLQKKAPTIKQNCQILLGQRKIQTPNWTDKKCNNVLTPKEICEGLTLENATLKSDINNYGCKKISLKTPKPCTNLSDQMKKNVEELKNRNCNKVMGSLN